MSRNAVSNYEIGHRMPERKIIKYCSGVRCAAGLSASGILGKRAEQEKNKEEKNWYAEMRNKSVQTVKNEKEAGNVRSPCTLKAEMPAVAE